MKKIQCVLILVCLAQLSMAQMTGMIKYKETVKLEIEMEDLPGVDIQSMLPESTSFGKALYFNETASLYVDIEGEEVEDTEISSDDGSFQMVFKMGDDMENILYTDLQQNSIVHQEGFMGKSFVVSKSIPEYKWKITGEKIKFLDYECMKATTMLDDKSIVVWFAPQLPAKIGPSDYGQLPGAILMVSEDDGKKEIMATAVTLGAIEKEIKEPKDGKKVTAAEYTKIQDDKMKEMKEQSGGAHIMIRG